MQNPRLIMYHKQSTSARTLFLKLSYGGVCGFSPLPMPAQLLEQVPQEKLSIHPAPLISEAQRYFGLNSGALEVESDYKVLVDVANGPIQVFLARFTSIDPPFEAVKKHEAEFIDLTQARNLPLVELELLREAYVLILGG